jgi:hypothetical protein
LTVQQQLGVYELSERNVILLFLFLTTFFLSVVRRWLGRQTAFFFSLLLLLSVCHWRWLWR